MSRASRTRSGGGCLRTLGVSVAVLALVAVTAAAIGYWLFFVRAATAVEANKPVQVEIPAGASTRAIAEQLAAAGVVANPNMFRLVARRERADGKLRAGTYELSTRMPYELVIDRLKQGPPVEYITITIPEGFVLEQIAARLEKQAGIPAAEFLELAEGGAAEFTAEHPYLKDAYKDSLEGYLFPKTYRLKKGTSAREAIEVLLDQFDRELAQVDTSAAEDRGLTLNDIVVLASMIERETKVAKERPLVSSVIYNRLARGMRLEIDATIEYVLPGNRFRLRYSDLRLDSPYNTYRNKGLPPGPISSPGLESLKAAANPADTDYIYYVLTAKNGTHTFTTNEADFLKAKRKSKEVFGR